MSYIDKITNKDTGESRVISPAAEAVRVSNENYEGENLDEVLDEVAHAIEDAGSGDGTVTGVKIGSTTYEPTDGVVDLSSPMGNKVDKNGTDSLMTATEHTKLAGIAAGAQVNVINSISVNGTARTPVNGNVDIIVEGGGSVESVTVSGTKYTPDSNGDINLGDLRGQDGNSGVSSADGVESVNNLNGGTTDTQSKVYVLGANQGKRLRDQMELIYQRVQTLYGLLGNIAFWDGKPSASALLPDLDWGAPKHAVAITNSLSNSVITRNGEPVSSSIQAEEGSTVTLIVAPASGYALTSVSYVKDGGSSTNATSLGDGTYKIEFVMGGSDVTITVSGTALAAYNVTLNLTNCSKVSGPTSVVSGGEATFVFAAAQGYALPSTTPTVSGAAATDWDETTGTLVIGSVSGAVTITIAAVQAFTGTINIKKITGWPSIDNSGNVTPVQGGESDYDMTIVDDNTIACSVDGSWKINIPSGYGLFSAVLKSNGTDVSEKIDFSTLVIDNTSLTGTLVLDLVVAEATDGMFLGKSFHYSEGLTKTNPGNLISGGVPVNSSSPNDDWCCMSEFAKIPTGANKLKFIHGNILSSNTNSNNIQNKRGCLISYASDGTPVGHVTIYTGGQTQRILDWPTDDSNNTLYVRASFIQNKLSYTDAGIYFSTDGGTTWQQVFDATEKDITTT